MQYRDDLDQIWCACHDGHYDLRGKDIEGPPPGHLEEYDVTVVDEQIIVCKRN